MNGRCIFCSSTGPFCKEEHIIPESLGGEETVPEGFVCDNCNSYFGSKVESDALTLSPLVVGRMFLSVKSKKGKFARSQRVTFGKDYEGLYFGAEGSDQTDIIVHVNEEVYNSLLSGKVNRFYLPVEGMGSLVRLLLKMALEFLATADKGKHVDVYDDVFDCARHAARNPDPLRVWKLASTIFPMGSEWELGKDSKGHYARETQYYYSIGRLANQMTFYFQYWILAFLVPLTLEGNFEVGVDLLNKSNPQLQPFEIQTVRLAWSTIHK